MTSTTTEPVVPHPGHTGEHGDALRHDWDYIRIALILMVLSTGAESSSLPPRERGKDRMGALIFSRTIRT